MYLFADIYLYEIVHERGLYHSEIVLYHIFVDFLLNVVVLDW